MTEAIEQYLRKHGKTGIALTATEQKKFILFLKTLKDHVFINKITLR